MLKALALFAGAIFEEPLRTFRAVLVSDLSLFRSVYIRHKETKRDLVAMGSNVPSDNFQSFGEE
jgi:hypothetical protein